jgi:hypothetical protein
MKARLKLNLILGGKFVPFDTVVDESEVPEHQRIPDILDYSVESRDDGKVLILKDLVFQSVPKAGADGIPASYPVSVMAGETLDLNRVPASHRKMLKEGSDYATKWTREEQEQIRKDSDEVYLRHFQSEPAPVHSRGAR